MASSFHAEVASIKQMNNGVVGNGTQQGQKILQSFKANCFSLKWNPTRSEDLVIIQIKMFQLKMVGDG